MRKITFWPLLVAMIFAFALNSSAAKKVHTLGDSTMANYKEDQTPTRGWGMYFGNFLTNGWTSINYALGGRDSRGGYEELWQTAKKQVSEGDYVIITFAHNDEKNSGMDGLQLTAYYESIGQTWTEKRGSIPSTTYKENLTKIVDEARALGAIPIVCSPVCRSYFSGNSISRAGRHDLGDSYKILTENGPVDGPKLAADDHTMDYAYHAEQLTREKGIDFIDLTNATADLYLSYGTRDKCEAQLFDGQGSTHFNTTGALLVARECARLMKSQGILADDIVLPTDLSVSPDNADLGEAYKGQTLSKELTLNGFGLTPESGTITITATEGILLSFDKTNWQTSLSVDYTSSTLIKTFYAQMVLTESGVNSGVITVEGSTKVEVPVKATAVVLEGGADVKAYWRLEKDDACELTGPATVIDESYSNMYVQRYANPNAKTVWPEGTGYDASRKMQRNLITGDTWPANEIDDNPDRYIQFGLKPNAGNSLKISNISLFLCGAGGNGMCAHVYYSTDDFKTRTTLFEGKKMTANNPVLVESTPVITLNDGEELLLRVYPWYNGEASGKTICLSDVTISGRAFDAQSTAISSTIGDDNTTVAYFSIDGRQQQSLSHGINLVRLTDGSVKKILR